MSLTKIISTLKVALLCIGISLPLAAIGQYCTSNATSTTFGFIQSVQIGSIVQPSPSGCGQTYTDYTATASTSQSPGNTMNFTIDVQGCSGGSWTHSTKIFIDYNQNGVFTDPGEEVFALGGHQYGFVTGSITIPTSASFGATRIRIVTVETSIITNVQPCGTYTWGETEDYTLIIENPALNDAGIVALNQPGNPICDGSNRLSVSLKNFGRINLNSANINWQIIRPGFPAPFPLQTYSWSGNLSPDSTASNIFLGNFQGGFQVGDILTVYSSLPNGVTDSVPNNDTLVTTFRNGFFGGFYTVGDTTGGARDFPNLRTAIDFLNGIDGLCDSIIFEIQDGETYTGQYRIDRTLGASFNVPIVFRSESRDPANVTITNNASNPDSNFTIFLNGSQGVIFEGITIVATNVNNSLGTAIFFGETTRNILVKNCELRNSVNNDNVNGAIIRSVGITENIYIENNTFRNGSFGARLLSTEGTNNGWNFKNNQFINQRIRFLEIEGGRNLRIEKNLFTSNSNLITNNNRESIGIHLIECHGNNAINGNRISNSGLFPSDGVKLTDCLGSSAGYTRIFNNMISSGLSFSNGVFTAISVINSNIVDVINNSTISRGINPNSAAFYAEDGGGINVVNNIFQNDGAGYAMLVDGRTSINLANHNNYHTAGLNFIKYGNQSFSNLLQIGSTYGSDINSINVNPQFLNIPNDLRSCNFALDSAGTGIPYILYDYDGDNRNPQFPDIGAIEFEDISNFTLGTDQKICLGDSVILFGPTMLGDNIIWSTGDTTRNIVVKDSRVITATVSNACGSAISDVEVLTSQAVDLDKDSLRLCSEGTDTIRTIVNEQVSYQWNTGSNQSFITVDTAGVYSVTITNSFGCINELSTEVTQAARPNILTNMPNNTFCTGSPSFLDAGVTNVSYKWTPTVVNPNNQITVITTGGKYWVEIDDNGCISSDTIEIVEITPPQAAFTAVNSFFTWQFQNNSTPANMSYFWDFGDGNTSTLKDPIHVYAAAGVYTVRLTVSNGCGARSTSMKVAAITPGYENLSNDGKINVYPNPSENFINIESQNGFKSVELVKIFDINGKLVLENQINTGNIFRMNISELNAGIYFVNVVSDELNFRAKIIKK